MTSSTAPTSREPGHLVRLVRSRLGDDATIGATAHTDGDRFQVRVDRLVELVTFLQNDRDADLQTLVHLTGLDTGPREDESAPRFQVLYHLRSPRLGYRALLTVELPANAATVPSLTPLFASAEPLERELYEMLGVYPEGHPKLRPLLLYAGFVGHPLRKDYRATKHQPLVATLDSERPPVVVEDVEEPE